MVAKEDSVNVKTENISKYDYFPGFLLYLKKCIVYRPMKHQTKRLKIVTSATKL